MDKELIIVKCVRDKWKSSETDLPVEGFYYEVINYDYSDDKELYIILKGFDSTKAFQACNFDLEEGEFEIKTTSFLARKENPSWPPIGGVNCRHEYKLKLDIDDAWMNAIKGMWEDQP